MAQTKCVNSGVLQVALAYLEKQLPKAVSARDFVEAAAVKEDIDALTREIEDLKLDLDALDQHHDNSVNVFKLQGN